MKSENAHANSDRPANALGCRLRDMTAGCTAGTGNGVGAQRSNGSGTGGRREPASSSFRTYPTARKSNPCCCASLWASPNSRRATISSGVVKFLAFGDNGYLNKVDNVVNFAFLTGSFPPDITNNARRKRAVKVGGGINVQQQLMPSLGFFLRASMCDGRYETVDYTEFDRRPRPKAATTRKSGSPP
ncbi:hypothetical protein [Methylocystis rosea]|uniref:Uncharacterized protein n=1 Tax=Methylocystis rosea TaxID=173366 RepID=A0A3G8MCH1_9HYPH|nr:hypothetical protein [Methylocystis rosea]AZG78890.1 hypothetical protein EHO51_18905 [Methylocystis rosea]